MTREMLLAIEGKEHECIPLPRDAIDTQQLTRALRGTIGRVQAYRSSRGGDPYSNIDVEELFSAIEMLARRSELTLAPFVREWEPGFEVIPRMGMPDHYSDVAFELQEVLTSGDPIAFVRAVEGVASKQREQAIYSELRLAMLESLEKLLTPREWPQFAYLAPAVAKVDRIATLNYDLGIEWVANDLGRGCDDGVGRWQGGLRWPDNNSDIQLLKLHGSINWAQVHQDGVTDPTELTRFESLPINKRRDDSWVSRYYPADAGVIFGSQGKLRPDGPFLAMLVAFSRWLESADRLIVCGYSFRDEHVNVILRDWLEGAAGRVLEIIDPSFPEWGSITNWDRVPGFVYATLAYNNFSEGCPPYPWGWGLQKPKIRHHRLPASEGLAALLT
ncbi:hypothetical protein C3E87_05685 [Tessaracoccus sp. ZS01]|nr:hypothetical protein [Tessaracoccus sp. ZS01]